MCCIAKTSLNDAFHIGKVNAKADILYDNWKRVVAVFEEIDLMRKRKVYISLSFFIRTFQVHNF